MGRIILVSGGTRSGKSRFAESLFLKSNAPLHYVATCPRIPGDADLDQRILLHQERRAGFGIIDIEEELDLTGVLASSRKAGASVLLECLGLWINNILFSGKLDNLKQEKQIIEWVHQQCNLWRQGPGTLIVVAPEAGLGMQPMERSARQWLDLLGSARNAFAQEADEVWMMVSGIPLQIKSSESK